MRKVRIIGNHPWSGHSAHVIGKENTIIGTMYCLAIIRCDAMNGHQVMAKRSDFITMSQHLRKLVRKFKEATRDEKE